MPQDVRIQGLAEELLRRRDERTRVLDALRQFTVWLKAGLSEALAAVEEYSRSCSKGVDAALLDERLERLSFEWGGQGVIVAPVPFVASPYPGSPALPLLQDQPAGRAVIFLQPDVRYASAWPISEVYVFPQGEWCAGGIGVMIDGRLEENEVCTFAVTLLDQLTRNLPREHRPIADTAFDFAAGAIRQPIGFTPQQQDAAVEAVSRTGQ